jgi:hypothetical protein
VLTLLVVQEVIQLWKLNNNNNNNKKHKNQKELLSSCRIPPFPLLGMPSTPPPDEEYSENLVEPLQSSSFELWQGRTDLNLGIKVDHWHVPGMVNSKQILISSSMCWTKDCRNNESKSQCAITF